MRTITEIQNMLEELSDQPVHKIGYLMATN